MNDPLALLAERGFVSQCSDPEGLRKLFQSERVSFYVGFDATAPSLHAGHLQQLMLMAHLQRAGHRPIALLGGGTTRIGDPTGRTEARRILSIETINSNAASIRGQIERFLDFGPDGAIMVNNADWLADLNYIDFLREIGVHFSVNRMLSFETYKMRMETGLSFIEFNYQILQSYDYLMLFRRLGCRLQMGGDDQWGNIVAGMDLIRRVEGAEAYALTSPLVTRSDGKKMGKSEGGALFLDSALVSPFEFFQFWRNVPDADVEKFLLRFTFLPVNEAHELGSLRDEKINQAKERLAYELTKTVHGEEEAAKARDAARVAFGGSRAGAAAESGAAAGDLSSVPTLEIDRAEIRRGVSAADLLARTSLCSSKSEARRLVLQGGALANDRKIEQPDALITENDVVDGAILLRAGKKRYFRITVK